MDRVTRTRSLVAARAAAISAIVAVTLFASGLALTPSMVDARGGRSASSRSGDVAVRGHLRSNGTYVAPHYRSAPDGTKSNNWSTLGNVNPYTGKSGTVDQFGPNRRSYGYTGPTYIPPTRPSSRPVPAVPRATYPPEQPRSPSPPASATLPTRDSVPAPVDSTYTSPAPRVPVIAPFHPQHGSPLANEPLNEPLPAMLTVPEAPTARAARAAPDGASMVEAAAPQCPWGHKPYGRLCVPYQPPANARISASGDDFECYETHRRYRFSCVPFIGAELPPPTHLVNGAN